MSYRTTVVHLVHSSPPHHCVSHDCATNVCISLLFPASLLKLLIQKYFNGFLEIFYVENHVYCTYSLTYSIPIWMNSNLFTFFFFDWLLHLWNNSEWSQQEEIPLFVIFSLSPWSTWLVWVFHRCTLSFPSILNLLMFFIIRVRDLFSYLVWVYWCYVE